MSTDFAGVKQITLSPTAKLVFQHQGIKEKLYINSGANAIKWAYTLNQKSQSTIGGEVVQLLSCYVGPMSIEGLATSPDELNRIRQWFLEYFERAGTVYKDAQFRDETACTFKYPARGWSFYIQPTNFGPWEQDNQVYTPPWSITAEIVSDNAVNYLSGATMTSFTGPLSNPAFIAVGYSDPTGHGANSRFVNPQWDAANADIAGTMGDNFQRLVASYLGGSFADQAFNSLIHTPGANNVDSEYQSLFGGTSLTTSTSSRGLESAGGAGSGGTYTYGGPANPTDPQGVAADIFAQFEAAGVPGRLGVAVAIQESGLNPNQTQYGCNSPNCGIGLFQVNGDGTGRGNHTSEIKAAGAQRKFSSSDGNITSAYPVDDQIADAAAWFASANPFGTNFDRENINQMAQWAQAAQAAGNPYFAGGQAQPVFVTVWNKALTYLQNIDTSTAANSIIGVARSQVGVTEIGGANSGPKVSQYLASVGLPEGDPWCCAFVFWVFSQVLGSQNPLPRTGLVYSVYNWGQLHNYLVPVNQAQLGDLAIYDSDGAISADPSKYHIGIVSSASGGAVNQVISGNFGNMVSDQTGNRNLVALVRVPIPPSAIGS